MQMSAIRFLKIGHIEECLDGTYLVGHLPGIGGSFDTAAQFFNAWAGEAKFPSVRSVRCAAGDGRAAVPRKRSNASGW